MDLGEEGFELAVEDLVEAGEAAMFFELAVVEGFAVDDGFLLELAADAVEPVLAWMVERGHIDATLGYDGSTGELSAG